MFWIVLKWVDIDALCIWIDTIPLINAHVSFRFLHKIVDDVLKLARFSYANYETAIRVVDYLQNEIEYIPWKAAFVNFDFIYARLKPSEEPLFKVS